MAKILSIQLQSSNTVFWKFVKFFTFFSELTIHCKGVYLTICYIPKHFAEENLFYCQYTTFSALKNNKEKIQRPLPFGQYIQKFLTLSHSCRRAPGTGSSQRCLGCGPPCPYWQASQPCRYHHRPCRGLYLLAQLASQQSSSSTLSPALFFQAPSLDHSPKQFSLKIQSLAQVRHSKYFFLFDFNFSRNHSTKQTSKMRESHILNLEDGLASPKRA